KFLDIGFPLIKIFKYIFYALSLVTLYYLIQVARGKGLSVIFDTTKPELSGTFLREKLIPYEINNSTKFIFSIHYITSMVSYIYLTIKAYKKREYIIFSGIIFTIISILFTNSYHLLSLTFWLPLNILADALELFRIQRVQKRMINKKMTDFNSHIEDINSKIKKFKTIESIYQTKTHDINNSLTLSVLNLEKLKLLMRKDKNISTEIISNHIDKSIQSQLFASQLTKSDSKKTIFSLSKMVERLAMMCDIHLEHNAVKTDILICGIKYKFENIFNNLIKNTYEEINKMSAPWIKVNFSTTGEMLNIHFTDSGEYQNIKDPTKLFDNLYTTKETDTNQGIGLYSVKKNISELGGDIQLTEVQGNTSFKITLPLSYLTQLETNDD
ncbi:MAG: signal transduction histidine kinase, partial [Thermoproteota archaeon]